MPVTYLIRFNVKPEQRARFLSLLNGVLDAMRHEPMFHAATLHHDPQASGRFMLCETWESQDPYGGRPASAGPGALRSASPRWRAPWSPRCPCPTSPQCSPKPRSTTPSRQSV